MEIPKLEGHRPIALDNKSIKVDSFSISKGIVEHTSDHTVSKETRESSNGLKRLHAGENPIKGVNRNPEKDTDSRGD